MKISRDLGAPVVFNSLETDVWQLDLDLGRVEGGSSGAPYYNQNHQVIGQHWRRPQNDGTNQPCIWTMTQGGRFDRSWTGGGTNATRLSNWLDQENTNSISTNTTNINSLVTAPSPQNGYIYINGPTDICGSTTYTLTGAAAGSTILWSLSNPSIATLSPNGNQVTVTPLIFGQPVNLNVTITQLCSQPKTEVFLIRPFANILTTPKEMVVCYDDYYNLEYPRPIDVSFCPSNGIVTWDVPSEFNGDYTIVGNRLTLNSGPSYSISQYSPLVISASVYDPSSGISYSTQTNFWTQSCYGYNERLNSNKTTLSPNPTSGQFFITIENKDKEKTIKQVRVKNKMGIPIFYKRFYDNKKTQSINLVNQPSDIYIVEIFNGKIWTSQKLSLQH